MITKMNLVFLKKTKYDDDIPFKILLPFDLTNFYHMFKGCMSINIHSFSVGLF